MRALAIALLLASDAPSLSVAGYAGALEKLAVQLRAGELERARTGAAALGAARVGDEALPVDPVLLRRLREVEPAGATALARRLEALAGELRAAGGATASPDPALLARLTREAEARKAAAGGQVDARLPDARPLPQRIRDWLDAAARWLNEWIDALLDWLGKLRPERDPAAGDPPSTRAVAALVTAVALLLGLLAWRTLRRRPVPTLGRATALAQAVRDEDPLSREAEEWERYAAELSSAGRCREAVRALYHAVLVTLFRSGRLQAARGRTNWEYVARTPASAPWRSSFVSLTGAFDREWYGHDATDREALEAYAGEARGLLAELREAGA